MSIFHWLWLIVSKLVACWHPPQIWFWLYYDIFFQDIDSLIEISFSKSRDHIRRYVFFLDSMIMFPWLWLIISKLVACWNPPPIWFWRYYYFFVNAHRHANRHVIFKIPGTTFVVMWFFGFHENSPLTLAYRFKTCRLLKSASHMIWAFWLFLF